MFFRFNICLFIYLFIFFERSHYICTSLDTQKKHSVLLSTHKNAFLFSRVYATMFKLGP